VTMIAMPGRPESPAASSCCPPRSRLRCLDRFCERIGSLDHFLESVDSLDHFPESVDYLDRLLERTDSHGEKTCSRGEKTLYKHNRGWHRSVAQQRRGATGARVQRTDASPVSRTTLIGMDPVHTVEAVGSWLSVSVELVACHV
jgi:hypothetical protein